MSGKRQLWNKQHTHKDPHRRYRCCSRHHLQIHHMQAIHQSIGDVTPKSNNRQHSRIGSVCWHRTHITIKKTYQHCHKTYHLWQNLSELTPSHNLTKPLLMRMCNLTSGNDVWSSLRLRELRKLLEAQGAMRASRAYREVIVSARARCH